MTRGSRALAVLLTLVFGILAADLGARVVYLASPGLPTGAELAAISATVYPGAPVALESDGWFDRDEPAWLTVMMDRENDPRRSSRGLSTGADLPGDSPPWVAAARARVAAAGWQIKGDGGSGNEHSFWATRQNLKLEVYGNSPDPEPGVAPTLSSWADLTRTQSWWMTVLIVVIGLAGALPGWLLAAEPSVTGAV